MDDGLDRELEKGIQRSQVAQLPGLQAAGAWSRHALSYERKSNAESGTMNGDRPQAIFRRENFLLTRHRKIK
jgi:hypothetical protein